MPGQYRWIALLAVVVLIWTLLAHWPMSDSSKPKPKPKPKAFRQRLVAVGDLHGDFEGAKKVFRMAGVIDKDAAWSGGTDILVQTGDIVDRGTYALEIYQMMARLRSEAHGAGGRVVSILGNHEVMNALGDWRYVSQADIKNWGGTEKRQHDLSLDGWLGKEWMANYTVTQRVALGPHKSAPTLAFTHGSLRPSFPDLLPYPDRINELGRSLLERALTPPLAPPYPPNPYSGLPKGTTKEEAELYAEGGPLWWRGLAESNERMVCKWAKQLKEKLGVRRIIGGHTPDFDKIVHRCDGSVIIIDTGISYAYGGILSALEIIYTLTPVDDGEDTDADADADGVGALTPGARYIEREEVNALYKSGKKRIALDVREVTL